AVIRRGSRGGVAPLSPDGCRANLLSRGRWWRLGCATLADRALALRLRRASGRAFPPRGTARRRPALCVGLLALAIPLLTLALAAPTRFGRAKPTRHGSSPGKRHQQIGRAHV